MSQLALNAGESRTLIATLDPAQTGAAIAWSCDSSAAAVAADGTVTNLNTAARDGPGHHHRHLEREERLLHRGLPARPAHRHRLRRGRGPERALRPGHHQPVVDQRSNGDVLIVESVENGWCKVLYRNAAGQAARGYVSADYLQLSN